MLLKGALFMRTRSIKELADGETTTDKLTMFHFLRLVVDIKYRDKYGNSLAPTGVNEYNYVMNSANLPDQAHPVDPVLEGEGRRGVFDEA